MKKSNPKYKTKNRKIFPNNPKIEWIGKEKYVKKKYKRKRDKIGFNMV